MEERPPSTSRVVLAKAATQGRGRGGVSVSRHSRAPLNCVIPAGRNPEGRAAPVRAEGNRSMKGRRVGAPHCAQLSPPPTKHPSVGAVREPPVPPRREPLRTPSRTRPELSHVPHHRSRPPLVILAPLSSKLRTQGRGAGYPSPLSSFLRRQESRGASGGAPPPATPPATTPFPPSPTPRYPPPMAHARKPLEQTLARTVRIDDRMRFGSQQQGIVSTPRNVLALGLYLQCVTSATKRMQRQALLSYTGPGDKASSDTPGPKNKAPTPHPGAPKTQG